MGSAGNCSPACLARSALRRTVRSRRSSAREVGVESGPYLVLLGRQGVLESLRIDPHDHIAEHGDEPPVGVVGEARIAGPPSKSLDRFVVEPEVENGVHHARHGEHGAGADREEQRVLGIAQASCRSVSQEPSGGP